MSRRSSRPFVSSSVNAEVSPRGATVRAVPPRAVLMSGAALLRTNPRPTPDDVRQALSGNLCRCGAYPNIVAAVQSVLAKESGQ